LDLRDLVGILRAGDKRLGIEEAAEVLIFIAS
jgi:hypothetical protein